MNYSVLKITNNISEYPECEIDTKNNPKLIAHVEDEMDIFIKADDGRFWLAEDFFAMVDFKLFSSAE